MRSGLGSLVRGVVRSGELGGCCAFVHLVWRLSGMVGSACIVFGPVCTLGSWMGVLHGRRERDWYGWMIV
jgi:hypothetical protein